MLVTVTKPVLLKVIYYRIDHPLLLQEFSWGYDDYIPDLVKTHKFLNYWHQNISAPISQILISISEEYHRKYRSIDEFKNIH